ncbi:hypothetical protein OHD17_00655 [Escherichia coli]|uniref:hypothetical protein n=1 Tax=Escherichia coli TaxID=562 RepID=UPI002238C4B2|nr:hypothetical protein [Escherichia coli]
MSGNIRVGLIGMVASKTFRTPLIAGTPGPELAVISSSMKQSKSRLANGYGCL